MNPIGSHELLAALQKSTGKRTEGFFEHLYNQYIYSYNHKCMEEGIHRKKAGNQFTDLIKLS